MIGSHRPSPVDLIPNRAMHLDSLPDRISPIYFYDKSLLFLSDSDSLDMPQQRIYGMP